MESASDAAFSANEHLSGSVATAAACFSAMGLLCCVQMFFLISITFRRRSGLYFWSITGATLAQFCISFSMFLETWVLVDRLPGILYAMSTLGYLFFPVLGYLVLYSRLHLLLASERVLSFALVLIALEWTLAEFPMALLETLSLFYPDSNKIATAYKLSWEFEEALYPAVDLVLCSLYVLQVKRMWGHSEDRTKGVLRQVIVMTALLILMDMSWIVIQNASNDNWADAVEVSSFHQIGTRPLANEHKSFLMPVKLQAEMYILNMLTILSRAKLTEAQSYLASEPEVFASRQMENLNTCQCTTAKDQDGVRHRTEEIDNKEMDRESNRCRSL
jgi:hypothetical protein